jgi:hypothetical protein
MPSLSHDDYLTGAKVPIITITIAIAYAPIRLVFLLRIVPDNRLIGLFFLTMGEMVGVTPPFGNISANSRRIDSVEHDAHFSLWRRACSIHLRPKGRDARRGKSR